MRGDQGERRPFFGVFLYTSSWRNRRYGRRELKITMIGHSTVLIEMGGTRILTDPYFSLRGNPVFARVAPPAKSREESRDVEGVLVSHSHWDHVDGPYLRSLGATPVVTPQWNRGLLKLLGGRNVLGLKRWESLEIGGLRITAVPALHLAVAAGFVLEGEGRAVYFAGDTFCRPFMGEIAQRFHPELALLPVTTYSVPMTMGERQAVKAVSLLKPRVVVPIHLGIRPRSPLMRNGQTPEGFARLLGESGSSTQVALLAEGDSREF